MRPLPYGEIHKKKKAQQEKASFTTFAQEYANMEDLLHIQQKNLTDLPSFSVVQSILVKAYRVNNKPSFEMLITKCRSRQQDHKEKRFNIHNETNCRSTVTSQKCSKCTNNSNISGMTFCEVIMQIPPERDFIQWYIRNICLMASPKVSWRQRRYPRRWNMRPLPGGEILTKKKASTPRSFIYDVCLGICKHGKFAP